MKISYQWLKEFVNFEIPPRQLADALTLSGTVVETIEEAGADSILDFDLTSNRPDCLSHQGIAREAAALCQLPLRKVLSNPKEIQESAAGQISVEIEAPALCSRYCARVIRGVKVGPSPSWLVERLEALGLRSINNVADLTNYVLRELGHPLHAFDLEKIGGRKIVVREARSGEKMFTLDGEERELRAGMLVIADAEKPVALAGIMGGLESEISFSTREVLLESAWFNPISIRKTSKQLGMHTEASHRFERGADIEATVTALNRVAEMILELAGGEILEGIVDCYPAAFYRAPIWLRKSRLLQVMGTEVPPAMVARILTSLEFQIQEETEAGWLVTLPSFRLDVEREIDLIEEIARHYGYDKFSSRLPSWTGWGCRRPEHLRQLALQNCLGGLGYHETLTYSFIDQAENRRYSGLDTVRLQNPLSSEMEVMRTSLVPGLLQSLLRNYNRGIKSLRIYEMGRIYSWQKDGQTQEQPLLGMLSTGNAVEKEVHLNERPSSFFDLKGEVEALLETAGLPGRELSFRPPRSASFGGLPVEVFHPGLCAEVWEKEECLGILGQLHPRVCDSYKIKQPVFVALFSLQALYGREEGEKRFQEIPRFPAIQRDLALVVDKGLEYRQIESAILGERMPEILRVSPFDLYLGEKLPGGKKGLAINIVYQSLERTLLEEEVKQLQERILSLLESRFGAQLRK
jgi:phenylalanyl-tRNA synthetase beta chain